VTAPTAQFIEHLGVLLSADGYPRVAGRLFGLMLLAPEPRSLDALATQLGVSKASISINVRILEEKGVVQRIGRHGDRRDYYQISDDILARSLEQRITRLRRFKEAVSNARQELPLDTKAVKDRLRNLESAYGHLLDLMTDALEGWRKQAEARRSARNT
jgi:DNA-binding transcriptional regulator GbsR (MarR family)